MCGCWPASRRAQPRRASCSDSRRNSTRLNWSVKFKNSSGRLIKFDGRLNKSSEDLFTIVSARGGELRARRRRPDREQLPLTCRWIKGRDSDQNENKSG